MKAPFSWLKEYVDIDISAKELEQKLFGCGFEVEELIDLGREISGVVVGEVLTCEKVEGTHLFLCQVNCGSYGTKQIVTGAPNVFAGMHTPAAMDQSSLPGGIHIHAKPLHGIPSEGMLCSGEELGLNDDLYPGAEVNGLLVLPEDSEPGTDIREVVGLNDYIFDISVTANRPDCQSILGIAREVAAVLGKEIKMPRTDYHPSDASFSGLRVEVQAPDLCPRYLAHGVRNIIPGESPRWMKRNLALCGLRSINNVVDITNYVLLEIGQPMHAFDLDMLQNSEIIVRRAEPGEKIQTLDEKEFTLSNENLVICDGNRPVALAGIMGGLNSEITDQTRNLLFEAAKFARDSVRKTSRALGQSSDSSARFEKGISEYTTELGMRRALHLIEELHCGEVTSSAFDEGTGSPKDGKRFTARISGINSILGIEVPAEDILRILKSLQFEVVQDGDLLQVTAPRYREDIEIGEPDLAEEVIREYGYDHVKPTFLKSAAVTSGGKKPEQLRQDKVKRIMCGQGYYEVSTLAFYADSDLDDLHLSQDAPERKVVRILNPITEKLAIMRSILVPSLLRITVENLKRGNTEGRIFELGNIYIPGESGRLPEERLHLGFAAFGGDEDFFSLKGSVEALGEAFGLDLGVERASDIPFLHPGISAYVLCQGERIGYFGKLANEVTSELKLHKDSRTHHNIFLGEIDYLLMMSHAQGSCRYQPISAWPPVERDLALTVDEEKTCGEMLEEIHKACRQVAKVELFDIYRGDQIGAGKKSMAFKILFQGDDHPLSSDEVDKYIRKILGNLKFKLGAEIR